MTDATIKYEIGNSEFRVIPDSSIDDVSYLNIVKKVYRNEKDANNAARSLLESHGKACFVAKTVTKFENVIKQLPLA